MALVSQEFLECLSVWAKETGCVCKVTQRETVDLIESAGRFHGPNSNLPPSELHSPAPSTVGVILKVSFLSQLYVIRFCAFYTWQAARRQQWELLNVSSAPNESTVMQRSNPKHQWEEQHTLPRAVETFFFVLVCVASSSGRTHSCYVGAPTYIFTVLRGDILC